MKKVGFIGFGNMAQAIITGLIESGNFSNDDICVYDTDGDKVKIASEKFNITVFENNEQLVDNAECITLAVKPNALQALLTSISDQLRKVNPLVISIAAGQSIDKLKNFMGYDAKIIRVMPNINAIAGKAVSGYAFSEKVGEADILLAEKILSSFGKCVEVSEEKFSAYSAIAGCSPAYSYIFADAIARVGVKYGITKKEALDIVTESIIETVKNGCKKESTEMKKTVLNAIEAAYIKDKELGK